MSEIIDMFQFAIKGYVSSNFENKNLIMLFVFDSAYYLWLYGNYNFSDVSPLQQVCDLW